MSDICVARYARKMLGSRIKIKSLLSPLHLCRIHWTLLFMFIVVLLHIVICIEIDINNEQELRELLITPLPLNFGHLTLN